MVIGFINIDDTRDKFTKRANIFLSFLLAQCMTYFFHKNMCWAFEPSRFFLQYVFFGDKV